MRAMTSSACRAPNSVQCGIEGCFAPNLRMRGRQKAAGLLAVLPDVLGRGNHPRQALSPRTFRRRQTFPPPFVSRLRDDPVHHGALVGGIRKDAPRHVAKGRLGQAALDGVIQLQDGRWFRQCGRWFELARPRNLSVSLDFPLEEVE
jgi:hypothetical protein